MNLIDTRTSFHDALHDTDQLLIKRVQEIPQDWLDQLAESRKASTQGKMGNFHRFASIPVGIYEKWLNEGFDARKEKPAAIIAKMKREGLDYFLTTDRRL